MLNIYSNNVQQKWFYCVVACGENFISDDPEGPYNSILWVCCFFFFLNVDFYSHRLVSVHTQYLLFTTQIETGLQQQQSDLA